jgi:hypothetical protein
MNHRGDISNQKTQKNNGRVHRKPELFTCLTLAAVLVCLVMFSSVVSLPPQHIESSPTAHMFQNRQHSLSKKKIQHSSVKEIFSFKSVLNGKYVWVGDQNKVLASTNEAVCVSERSFEVVVIDEANEWIALRFLSMDPNKRHRYVQVGPPPQLSLLLAPRDASIDDHSLHFRIETVRGHSSHSRAGETPHILLYTSFALCLL